MPPASRWSGPDGPVPPWPYGRPGINFANVGLSFVLGLSSTARIEAESSSDKLIANRGRYFTPHGIRELVNSQQVWVGPRRP